MKAILRITVVETESHLQVYETPIPLLPSHRIARFRPGKPLLHCLRPSYGGARKPRTLNQPDGRRAARGKSIPRQHDRIRIRHTRMVDNLAVSRRPIDIARQHALHRLSAGESFPPPDARALDQSGPL